MSHELDFSKGKAAIAYTGKTPWHKHGVCFDEPLTAAQCIEFGGLDYDVELQSLQTVNGVVLPTHRAVVRTDTNHVLGVVGKNYKPLQNKDAFVFFDTLIEQGEARYETCGALKEGRQIWLLAKVEGQFEVLPHDVIDKYVLLTNRHDGLGCVQARFTPIRVVCNNTLSSALSRKTTEEVRIVHRGDVVNKLEFAAELLKKTHLFFDELNEQYKQMAFINLNSKQLYNYFHASLRPYYNNTQVGVDPEEVSGKLQKEIDVVTRLHEEGRGSDLPGVRGTLWGAYNAITEYVDYYKKPKRSEPVEFIGFGSGRLIKDHACNLAMRFIKNRSFETESDLVMAN